MLSIRYRGLGRHVLTHAGEEIGTIVGRTLRIAGFATEAEAVEARHAGYVALLRWVASRRDALRERAADVRADADAEAVAAPVTGEGDSVVARLVRAGPDDAADARPYAVEFRLPSGLYTAVALHAAQAVHSAIVAALAARAPREAPGRAGSRDAGVAAAT